MSTDLPPGVIIAAAPAELKLDGDDGDRSPWWRRYHDDEQRGPSALQAATEFPQRIEVEKPDVMRATKLFACSGSVDSSRYQEATKFRAMPDMDWIEARVALNRLMADVGTYTSRYRVTTLEYVALAEFALTASGFEGFMGKKGDNAVRLRKEFNAAILRLWSHLNQALQAAKNAADVLARPITNRLNGETWRGNIALWAMVPTTPDSWVRIIDATPDQSMSALDYLRALLAEWQARRPFAADVAGRLQIPDDLPSALDYAEAIHIAEMLAFTSEKLMTLYAGIMHSMPIYLLYPATSEHEAIELWWPWGRPLPLVDGGPAKPSRPRKKVLDPSIVKATQPQDVVREVMKLTGINRTTAQRLTAPMRIGMRLARRRKAEALLRQGVTKAQVARSVGLSPSRISAMFKGQTHRTKKTRSHAYDADFDCFDEEDGHHS